MTWSFVVRFHRSKYAHVTIQTSISKSIFIHSFIHSHAPMTRRQS